MGAHDRLRAIMRAAYEERHALPPGPATARAIGVLPSLVGLRRQARAAVRALDEGDVALARDLLETAISFVDEGTDG